MLILRIRLNDYNKNWFTLIELIVVITILSILWSFSIIKYSDNEVENYLAEYKNQVVNRIDNLYKKALIGINWHYENKWITDTDYLKFYCDETNKTFYAYICDEINSFTPEFNNCKQIDFPTLNNIEYWNILSRYTKKDIEFNHCMYLDEWNNYYSNWSFYITVFTKFPNWSLQTYKESPTNSKNNLNDDTIVKNVKINVKHFSIVKEFYPIYFK